MRLGSTNRGETSLVVFSLREQHQEEGKSRRRCAEKGIWEKLARSQARGNDQTRAYDAPIASHRIHHGRSGQLCRLEMEERLPQRTDFDDLFNHLIRNYIGPNARFEPKI